MGGPSSAIDPPRRMGGNIINGRSGIHGGYVNFRYGNSQLFSHDFCHRIEGATALVHKGCDHVYGTIFVDFDERPRIVDDFSWLRRPCPGSVKSTAHADPPLDHPPLFGVLRSLVPADHHRPAIQLFFHTAASNHGFDSRSLAPERVAQPHVVLESERYWVDSQLLCHLVNQRFNGKSYLRVAKTLHGTGWYFVCVSRFAFELYMWKPV